MTFKKILIFLMIAVSVLATTVILYYKYFSTAQPTGIADYKKSRDKDMILNLFKKNWYWLVSEYSKDFSPENMVENLAHDKNLQSYGTVTIKVMLENGQPVGFVSYYMKKFYEGFIWFLAVKEEARNKKYGRLLMQTALNDLKERGAKYVRLITRTTNYSAQALYKRLGFRETNRDDKFIDYEIVFE